MGRYVLKTFGCKANLYDSQIIEAELQKRGWLPEGSDGRDSSDVKDPQEEVELCIINSCTVTDEADRQARKMATKFARENPNARVVMTGCAAEVAPESFQKTPGVSYVVGNQNKDQIVNLVLNELGKEAVAKRDAQVTPITSHILKHPSSPQMTSILGTVQTYQQILSKHPTEREWPAASDSFLPPPTHLQGHSDKTRAFLKIQEGCNSFCTYCIIPYGRGPSRSLRPREILEQVRTLVRDGIREIVITGTNIGDYGRDWNPEPVLDDLLEMILAETAIERLRVSSLDPTEITPKILSLMKENPRFCSHFHVSLQSPHSRILRLMKRKYQFEHVKECLNKIAQLPAPVGGVFVGMDVITGFPGETEEEFQWGYDALSQLPWTRLHVFPYSERSGTPATRLPNSVPQHIRVARTRKLNQLSMKRLTEHYQNILKKCQGEGEQIHLDLVLMEKKPANSSWVAGYTPNYLRVMISERELTERNQLVSVVPVDLMIDSKGNDVALVCRRP
jgi:threonylcarbamoyladenosine tRNA methylthiotransferase MtaB